MARVNSWDLEVDVVVIGSGAAGLVSAILAHDQGARVTVVECAETAGGATAASGGGLWIPVNDHHASQGIQDSREEALEYAKRLTMGRVPDELVETFVDTGPRMVRYLEERTPLKLATESGHPMPDYQQDFPGAKSGRCLFPQLFNKKELGDWETKLRPTPNSLPFPEGHSQTALFRPHKLAWDLIGELIEKGMVGNGNALAGMLLKGCLDRSISILLETRAVELIREDGRVIGVRAQRDGKDFFMKARGGVVLASGGFEWNEELKAKFLPGPLTHPASPRSLKGDGLVMAMEVEADLANMTEIWGTPTVAVPGELYEGEQMNRLCIAERSCPHSILVNRYGQRFVNESANYNDMSKAFNYFEPNTFDYRNVPCWAILDAQYREEYVCVTLMPGDPDPDWLARDETLEGLAKKVGIDTEALQATVIRFNDFVREGKDRDFHRGESVYDRWWGDWSATHPNLGTIEKPPFYALSVYPGALGTKGGPRTNAKGQVLSVRGQVIPGLYAAGNVMAGISGPAYWGPGGTIGPAMTWGYICGINAAKVAKGQE